MLLSEKDKAVEDFKMLQERYNALENQVKALKEENEKLIADSLNLTFIGIFLIQNIKIRILTNIL